MKGIGAAMLLMLLTACGDKNVFMGRHNVASGDYYLTYSAGNVRLLVDDPQILKKYQQEIRVEKAARTKTCTNPMQVLAFSLLCAIPHYKADHSLKLMHKKKGLIRELKYGEAYHLPEEMDKHVKISGATETWGNVDRFMARINHLQSIEGLRVVKADRPPYSHLVNIYFPLWIAPLEDDFNLGAFQDEVSRGIEQNLRERLSKEMAKHGIINYQLIATKHQPVHQQKNYDITDRRVTTSRPVIILHPRYQQDSSNYLYLTDYRADLFFMQINCDEFCAKQIKSINPLDWLQSPVSHTVFLDKIQSKVEQHGGLFNPKWTIDNRRFHDLSENDFLASKIENTPRDYIEGNIETGKRRFDLTENLTLSWEYNPEHAFNHSAAELSQPVLKGL